MQVLSQIDDGRKTAVVLKLNRIFDDNAHGGEEKNVVYGKKYSSALYSYEILRTR